MDAIYLGALYKAENCPSHCHSPATRNRYHRVSYLASVCKEGSHFKPLALFSHMHFILIYIDRAGIRITPPDIHSFDIAAVGQYSTNGLWKLKVITSQLPIHMSCH